MIEYSVRKAAISNYMTLARTLQPETLSAIECDITKQIKEQGFSHPHYDFLIVWLQTAATARADIFYI